MKIVDGDQWSQVISEKTREQNLDIFMKVADAVAFAHSKGIIHRDLKPENTMLGRFGEVFVTDWGTAVNLNKDSSAVVESPRARQSRLKVRKSDGFQSGESIVITNDVEVLERNEIVGVGNGEITLARPLQSDYAIDNNLRIVKAFNLAGTPCYMAPEMAGHQINKIGPTSDIYILGAILFDMVTGRPPHSGPTVTHCLMNALGNELVIPEGAEDDALLSIALKAMCSEPLDRYESVEQMQEAVREYRRHAESLSLTDRSLTLLAEAKKTGDYQTFSRAVFGFRDAIDLWHENSAASEGLLASRLAFGEAAFAKGDYDLVIQTVDCNVPAEAELFKNAETAKQRRLERESRIKWLQRVVVTVVSDRNCWALGTLVLRDQ
jgi:serine/threonine protein kinase